MIALLLLACFANEGAPLAPASSTEWLLVRSRSEMIGPLEWDQIGGLYLRGLDWRLVPSTTSEPETSRMVVGSPQDHPLVANLALNFDVTFVNDTLHFRGKAQPAGTGFVTYDTDPDGAGILFLTCGANSEGVLANFQTPLNIKFGQYLLTRGGEQVETGQNARHFELAQPRVIRLDLDHDRLLKSAPLNADGRALRLARGLVGYAHVYGALGATDLLPYAEQLLAQRDAIERARMMFAGRDHTEDVLAAYRKCEEALQLSPNSTPVFYVMYGLPDASNAKNFGIDAVTRRKQILFNLTALAVGAHYEAAIIHESIHSFQNLEGTRLVDRAMAEGVATVLSQQLTTGLSDADALLWTAEEFEAAEAGRERLIQAFLRDAPSTEDEVQKHWLILGITLPNLPETPSRSAYYVAWLAARAWMAEDGTRGPAELIRATPDELLASLKAL